MPTPRAPTTAAELASTRAPSTSAAPSSFNSSCTRAGAGTTATGAGTVPARFRSSGRGRPARAICEELLGAAGSRRVAHRLLGCRGMKKNSKLTIRRHTIKSLALEEVVGGRPRTVEGPDPEPAPPMGSVANSRCNSCTYGCNTQLFC
jgi:hypothetical protein